MKQFRQCFERLSVRTPRLHKKHETIGASEHSSLYMIPFVACCFQSWIQTLNILWNYQLYQCIPSVYLLLVYSAMSYRHSFSKVRPALYLQEYWEYLFDSDISSSECMGVYCLMSSRQQVKQSCCLKNCYWKRMAQINIL